MNADQEFLSYSVEFIVEFVRKAEGDEAAARVAGNRDSLLYWDAKIADWSTD